MYAMGHWNVRRFYALFRAKTTFRDQGMRTKEEEDKNHGDVE